MTILQLTQLIISPEKYTNDPKIQKRIDVSIVSENILYFYNVVMITNYRTGDYLRCTNVVLKGGTEITVEEYQEKLCTMIESMDKNNSITSTMH